jgi:hypothetical protein
VQVAAELLADVNGADELIRTVRARLFPAHVVLEPFTLWLGVAHAAGSSVRIKLYWNLCWRGTRDGWRRTLDALDGLDCRPRGTAARVLADLADRGYPKQLALTIRPTGGVEAKLYYRLAHVDLALLVRLAALGGLRAEPFEAYVGRLLRRGRDWADHRSGIAVGVDAAGEVEALALYHYVWPYFADDGELRQRLLTVSPAWDWDLTLYRAASRLIDGACRRCRRLLGYGVQRAGATGLHMYASTGHLA